MYKGDQQFIVLIQPFARFFYTFNMYITVKISQIEHF